MFYYKIDCLIIKLNVQLQNWNVLKVNIKVKKMQQFPVNKFLSCLQQTKSISSSLSIYFKQCQKHNMKWIYSISEQFLKIFSIKDKTYSLKLKVNAMYSIKLFVQFAQYQILTMFEVYLLPIIEDIASFGYQKQYFVLKENYSPNTANINDLSSNYVLLARDFIFETSLIKPFRTFESIQMQQNSNYKKSALRLKSKGIIEFVQKPQQQQKLAQTRNLFIKNLMKFDNQSENYVTFFMNKVEQYILNDNVKDLLDFKLIMKFGDVFLTSQTIGHCCQALEHQNFKIRTKSLLLIHDFVIWADIEAIMMINYAEYIEQITQKISKVSGNFSLNAGHDIYPQIECADFSKITFYTQFLRCLEIWSNCLPRTNFNSSSCIKIQQFGSQEYSPVYNLHKKLCEQKHFIFPGDINLKQCKKQLQQNFKLNKQRNKLIMKQLQTITFQQTSLNPSKSLTLNKYKLKPSQIKQKNQSFITLSYVENYIDKNENNLKMLIKQCQQNRIQQVQKNLISLNLFVQQFQNKLTNVDQTIDQEHLEKYFLRGEILSNKIQNVSDYFVDYQQNQINLIKFQQLIKKQILTNKISQVNQNRSIQFMSKLNQKRSEKSSFILNQGNMKNTQSYTKDMQLYNVSNDRFRVTKKQVHDNNIQALKKQLPNNKTKYLKNNQIDVRNNNNDQEISEVSKSSIKYQKQNSNHSIQNSHQDSYDFDTKQYNFRQVGKQNLNQLRPNQFKQSQFKTSQYYNVDQLKANKSISKSNIRIKQGFISNKSKRSSNLSSSKRSQQNLNSKKGSIYTQNAYMLVQENNRQKLAQHNSSKLSQLNASKIVQQKDSKLFQQNGSKLMQENDRKLVQQNSIKLTEKNGLKIVDKNDLKMVDKNRSKMVDKSGLKWIENNDIKTTDKKGLKQTDKNGLRQTNLQNKQFSQLYSQNQPQVNHSTNQRSHNLTSKLPQFQPANELSSQQKQQKNESHFVIVNQNLSKLKNLSNLSEKKSFVKNKIDDSIYASNENALRDMISFNGTNPVGFSKQYQSSTDKISSIEQAKKFQILNSHQRQIFQDQYSYKSLNQQNRQIKQQVNHQENPGFGMVFKNKSHPLSPKNSYHLKLNHPLSKESQKSRISSRSNEIIHLNHIKQPLKQNIYTSKDRFQTFNKIELGKQQMNGNSSVSSRSLRTSERFYKQSFKPQTIQNKFIQSSQQQQTPRIHQLSRQLKQEQWAKHKLDFKNSLYQQKLAISPKYQRTLFSYGSNEKFFKSSTSKSPSDSIFKKINSSNNIQLLASQQLEQIRKIQAKIQRVEFASQQLDEFKRASMKSPSKPSYIISPRSPRFRPNQNIKVKVQKVSLVSPSSTLKSPDSKRTYDLNQNSSQQYLSTPQGKLIRRSKYDKYLNQISTFNKQKKQLLRNKQLVFKNQSLEIGLTILRQKNKLKIIYFITSQSQMERLMCKIEQQNSKLNIKCTPTQLHNIQKKKQYKIYIICEIVEFPYSLPHIIISYKYPSKGIWLCSNPFSSDILPNIQLILPVYFTKFIQMLQVTSTQLSNILQTNEHKTFRTQQFPYNKKYIKQAQDINSYFPNLQLLSQNDAMTIYGGKAAFFGCCFLFKLTIKLNNFMYLQGYLYQINQNMQFCQKVIQYFLVCVEELFVKQIRP